MENMLEYESFDVGLKIYFRCPEMDLREVGLVSTTLHRIINKVAEEVLELPYRAPELYLPSSPYRKMFFGRPYDPLAVSLAVTNLQYGSLSAETKLRIHRVVRDLTIGAAGSLIASVIWSIGDSAPKSTTAEIQAPAQQVHPVDVGPNLRHMADRLAANGKPWELMIEDPRTGYRVVSRSR